MTTIAQLAKYAQLAQASYAYFGNDYSEYAEAIQEPKKGDFTAKEAEARRLG